MASKFGSSTFSHTRTSTFRSKIREELICAICLDFLSEPKVLNCAHSFCLACLDRTSQSTYRYRYERGSELKQGDFECPSCRQITKLPSSGRVEDLSTNYTLKRLVSVVSEDDKKAARQVLSSRSVHRPSIHQSRTLCSHHHRPVEYFCLDCNELLCPKCISSSHKRHSFDDVDKVLPKQIQTLRSLIQPACEVATRAEGMSEQLHADKEKITTNAHVTSAAIRTYFNRIRKVIDQRESALMSTVQKFSDVRLSRLDAHNQMLQNHHDAILVKVAELERLIEDNDIPKLLNQKQTITEELELQEQSVMAVSDLLKESSNQGTLLFREDQLPSSFTELGTLNERRQEGNSPFVTLRRVIVSEDEDPYLEVPLRFEDEESSTPQKQIRVDESRKSVEFEPDNKPTNIYNVPKAESGNRPSQDVNNVYNVPDPAKLSPTNQPSRRPRVPPRKSSAKNSPPGPPLQPRLRPRIPCAVPESGWGRSYQNFDPTSLPPRPDRTHDYQNYTPEVSPKASKSQTLPASHYNRSQSFPAMKPILRDSSDDSEDYEPVDDLLLPTPKPRTKPPPIPPNHPSRPKPKPKKRSESTAPIPEVPTVRPPKKRSYTLPADVTSPVSSPPMSPLQVPTILPPVKVIDNKMLCPPFKQETVYPSGISCCTEMDDILVVTDVFNHCLRLLDSNGAFIKKIGKEGRSGGQFKEPSAVTVDSDNNIYVTERDNPRVQKFTADGKYVTKFAQKTLTGSQLGDPLGVAVTANQSVLITDWDRNKILIFSNRGKLLDTIGKENNLFKFPAGLAVNNKGNILVTDRGNHCVWEITINGDVIRRIGSKGTSPGKLHFPYGVVVLGNKSIAITECGNNRISVFSENGDFVRCFGELGSEPGQFDHPRHLCVDSQGQLVVVDQMNQRLQVFQLW